MIFISPSLLSADFLHLEKDVKRICNSGADFIHLDIMDGHFVPNISFGPMIVKFVKQISSLPLDVHLMISEPTKYVNDFRNAGADIITVHYESEIHIHRLLQQIKATGAQVGLSICPGTHPEVLEYILDALDLILIMSVNPGFGGQKFITSSLDKIQYVKNMCDHAKKTNIKISVDGGIDSYYAKRSIEAGANMIVSGSYLFNSSSDEEFYDKVQKLSF